MCKGLAFYFGKTYTDMQQKESGWQDMRQDEKEKQGGLQTDGAQSPANGAAYRGRSRYRPEYKQLYRLVWLKRVVGVLLILCLLVVLVSAFVLWGLPALQKSGQPVASETSGAETSASTLSAQSAVPEYDAETGIMLYDDTFNLQIINSAHPATYTDTPETETFSGVLMHKNIVDAVRTMQKAARDEGVEIAFSAGYVSYYEQETLYQAQVDRLVQGGMTKIMAEKEAKSTVAAPGESDMQTGLCLTLKGDQATFTETAEYTWLLNSMGKYGFVFRYPAGKESATGLEANILVIRYVGAENAVKMRKLSMCLEEFVDYQA